MHCGKKNKKKRKFHIVNFEFKGIVGQEAVFLYCVISQNMCTDKEVNNY